MSPQSISFSGSGFLATYQLGVAQCFLNHAPWILRGAPFVLGASAGSLVAAAVVCEMNLITITDQMLCFVKRMRNFTLGPLNPSVSVFHWLENLLHEHLPPDAHQLANGRLAVAVTRLSDGKQMIISEYQSREDVVQVLLCSCFVPGYCGTVPPSFKGVLYLDGGYSRILPVMPGSSSPPLTVCPFAGDVDISPTDPPCAMDLVATGIVLKGNLANCARILNALFPMTLETVEQGFHNGYRDALQYLENNGIAPCLVLCKASEKTFNFNYTCKSKSLEKDKEEEKDLIGTDENGITETDNFSEQDFPGFEQRTSLNLEIFNHGTVNTHNTNTNMQVQTLWMTSFGKISIETYFSRMSSSIIDLAFLFYTVYAFTLYVSVLLFHVMAYLSMLGFPAKILSYLLLPLVLLCVLIQNWRRLGGMLSIPPSFLYFTWQNVRHSTIFMSSILMWTFQKNIKDRFELISLLFHLLKI
ncbi:1-acylglycerol-3-phosphate O-acyltransferase Pnpla3 isoform X1 [Gouania willdenowi]|uniref:1-acylglycerol-3-phosphate O-acyltransferase Pnpla3 isoform X1 n=1 Tax=Gouania willdenowi TaxID=441366 RepID=UPI0010546DD8|nr:1-acylglycerol-3-phosphate O-acyltransferase Pnpla3-like isoform X1 [Gouania willdenowi]